MTKAGLGESLIISMVQSQPGKYSMTRDDLVKLKQQGVSDKVLGAMIARGSGGAASSAASSMDTDVPAGVEIGVFYKKGGKWEEMLPEVVNWKTGGVIKNIASAGIVKPSRPGNRSGASRDCPISHSCLVIRG